MQLTLNALKRKIKAILYGPPPPPADPFRNTVSPKAIVFSGVNMEDSELGDYSYIGHNSILYNTKIGKFSSIGPGVIIGAGEHPTTFISTSPVCYQSKTSFDIKPQVDRFYGLANVFIGNDVWIGAQCYIKNGITIGDGAIIGVGSIVLKDVEPYAIMIGTPAKLLRHRFEKDKIAELLKIKWWNWSPEVIRERLSEIGSENVQNFVSNYKS